MILINNRLNRSELRSESPLKITTWDAFGYYLYLPSIFIYKDVKKLEWLDEIDKKYYLTGGYLYQAQKHPNGNYFIKYLGGVALLQSPFFFVAHQIAKHSKWEADGFSAPYQWCLGIGVILYCILAIFLLRSVLLRFYNDWITTITILLLLLATNAVQYICYDNAMCHAYIFPLYVVVLYTTIR